MKRKSVYISSYAKKIDIRFRPLANTRPLEVITAPNKVPQELKQYLITGAKIMLIRYSFGIIFSQKIIVRQQVFWLHVFMMNRAVKLKPVTTALLISLNYLINGRLDCVVNGQQLTIKKGTYQLYVLAKAIPYEAELKEGITIDFHTTVPPDVIPEMMHVYDDDDTLNKLFESDFKGTFAPHLFRISDAAKKHVQAILNQRHAADAKEKFARDARWDEHLKALFRIYITDRNAHTSREEWESGTRLQVSGLRTYIEQHLPEYRSSVNDPLSIKNLRQKLKLREPEFHKAIHQEFKCTWRELVNKVRMEKASQLLKQKDELTIADVAASLGYSYPTHFSRAFKSYYRHSPETHRKKTI